MTAIVDRPKSGHAAGVSKLESQCSIELANDPVLGIPSTVDLGKVRVRIATRIGGPIDERTIAMADGDDGWADDGMVRFVVR